MDFVEDYYPMLIEEGHLLNKCSFVMLKHMLEAGVVQITKGSIAKLHEDTKRSQALNILQWSNKKPTADAIRGNSVDKKAMMAIVHARTQDVIEPIAMSIEPLTNQFTLAL